MKRIFLIILFFSYVLAAQEEVLYDNTAKPGQRLLQNSISETKTTFSTVFADTVPEDIKEYFKVGDPFLPGNNESKIESEILITTEASSPGILKVPRKMEFTEYKIFPDSLDLISLKGLKVYWSETPGKEIELDSIDISAMELNGEWLKDLYFNQAKNFIPKTIPAKRKLKIGESFTDDFEIPIAFSEKSLKARQIYTLKEVKDGKGIFEVKMTAEIPEGFKKADALDPEFEDIFYTGITKYFIQGTGNMIFDIKNGIAERLDIESVSEMEILRLGGTTTTIFQSRTKTSETTKLLD